ncbi:PG0541 family transporter-associated protein, partial [Treponema endosymbiont of Eucomonympha sp.]|uniref:PG0541 family transporter-associated protein n=1 Tax=Treponema endosymbiont of Eucomonympha sp. TaxID=1580831 RepID=UPI000751444D
DAHRARYGDAAETYLRRGRQMQKIRLELIMSQAIEDDFLSGLEAAAPGAKYTQYADAAGRGYSAPKLGSSVWPQLNTVFVLCCEADEAETVLGVVRGLRERYAGEGLACFKSEVAEA